MHNTTNSIIVKILRILFLFLFFKLYVSGTVKLTPKHSKKKKSFSMLILFDCNSIIRSGINNYKTIYVDVVTSLYSNVSLGL